MLDEAREHSQIVEMTISLIQQPKVLYAYNEVVSSEDGDKVAETEVYKKYSRKKRSPNRVYYKRYQVDEAGRRRLIGVGTRRKHRKRMTREQAKAAGRLGRKPRTYNHIINYLKQYPCKLGIVPKNWYQLDLGSERQIRRVRDKLFEERRLVWDFVEIKRGKGYYYREGYRLRGNEPDWYIVPLWPEFFVVAALRSLYLRKLQAGAEYDDRPPEDALSKIYKFMWKYGVAKGEVESTYVWLTRNFDISQVIESGDDQHVAAKWADELAKALIKHYKDGELYGSNAVKEVLALGFYMALTQPHEVTRRFKSAAKIRTRAKKLLTDPKAYGLKFVKVYRKPHKPEPDYEFLAKRPDWAKVIELINDKPCFVDPRELAAILGIHYRTAINILKRLHEHGLIRIISVYKGLCGRHVYRCQRLFYLDELKKFLREDAAKRPQKFPLQPPPEAFKEVQARSTSQYETKYMSLARLAASEGAKLALRLLLTDGRSYKLVKRDPFKTGKEKALEIATSLATSTALQEKAIRLGIQQWAWRRWLRWGLVALDEAQCFGLLSLLKGNFAKLFNTKLTELIDTRWGTFIETSSPNSKIPDARTPEGVCEIFHLGREVGLVGLLGSPERLPDEDYRFVLAFATEFALAAYQAALEAIKEFVSWFLPTSRTLDGLICVGMICQDRRLSRAFADWLGRIVEAHLEWRSEWLWDEDKAQAAAFLGDAIDVLNEVIRVLRIDPQEFFRVFRFAAATGYTKVAWDYVGSPTARTEVFRLLHWCGIFGMTGAYYRIDFDDEIVSYSVATR